MHGEIVKTIDVLPGCYTLMTTSFTGVAININAESNPHRDTGNLKLNKCVAIPFGDFEGGQIVYAELGLHGQWLSACELHKNWIHDFL